MGSVLQLPWPATILILRTPWKQPASGRNLQALRCWLRRAREGWKCPLGNGSACEEKEDNNPRPTVPLHWRPPEQANSLGRLQQCHHPASQDPDQGVSSMALCHLKQDRSPWTGEVRAYDFIHALLVVGCLGPAADAAQLLPCSYTGRVSRCFLWLRSVAGWRGALLGHLSVPGRTQPTTLCLTLSLQGESVEVVKSIRSPTAGPCQHSRGGVAPPASPACGSRPWQRGQACL